MGAEDTDAIGDVDQRADPVEIALNKPEVSRSFQESNTGIHQNKITTNR